MADGRAPHNRLKDESSPYLLQHAHNPVNWYPWGEEAFAKARQEDKPVFLSIGYATCHWCHVMARESFEDDAIAKLMNQNFVNIKVDREERPDIDNTYMLVCQMLTGRGGWPLNVFLTPDKEPFYAATYIPKEERHGQPGMHQLIPWISDMWTNNRSKITQSTDSIIQAFQQSNDFSSENYIAEKILEKTFRQFKNQYDKSYAGFGTEPKFPTPHNLMFLLRYQHQTSNKEARQMAEQTLINMRRGGIYDHIGGGFHRYSTDQQWLVPHFEKMLYDQAMLLMAYTEGWQCTNNPLLKQTVTETAQYLFRDMQHPDGGFYSAEDADSEGQEGKFYVWNPAEIRNILPLPKAELAIEVFNITQEGNYRDETSGRKTGQSIAYLKKPISELAAEHNMEADQLRVELAVIKEKLLAARSERIRPLRDDKILTDWNGLIIAALAKAGRAFDNDEYVCEAQRCLQFISDHLIENEAMLQHRYYNGTSGINGHADDYAFLIWGLIELYETTFKSKYLEQAIRLNNQMIEQFWDSGIGGFYFTAESGEELLGRKKEMNDAALPSGNSVAMMNLLRLGRMTGRTEWEQMADTMGQLFAPQIQQAPTGFGGALQPILFTAGQPQEIIISGSKKEENTQNMINQLHHRFLPNAIRLLHDPDDSSLHSLIPFLTDFGMQENQPTAYVCQNYSCDLPVTSAEKMIELLT